MEEGGLAGAWDAAWDSKSGNGCSARNGPCGTGRSASDRQLTRLIQRSPASSPKPSRSSSPQRGPNPPSPPLSPSTLRTPTPHGTPSGPSPPPSPHSTSAPGTPSTPSSPPSRRRCAALGRFHPSNLTYEQRRLVSYTCKYYAAAGLIGTGVLIHNPYAAVPLVGAGVAVGGSALMDLHAGATEGRAARLRAAAGFALPHGHEAGPEGYAMHPLDNVLRRRGVGAGRGWRMCCGGGV